MIDANEEPEMTSNGSANPCLPCIMIALGPRLSGRSLTAGLVRLVAKATKKSHLHCFTAKMQLGR